MIFCLKPSNLQYYMNATKTPFQCNEKNRYSLALCQGLFAYCGLIVIIRTTVTV